jgi:hypothetical protein
LFKNCPAWVVGHNLRLCVGSRLYIIITNKTYSNEPIKPEERGYWGDSDVDGRIILRWIFRKLEGVLGIGWSWPRILTVGGHL